MRNAAYTAFSVSAPDTDNAGGRSASVADNWAISARSSRFSSPTPPPGVGANASHCALDSTGSGTPEPLYASDNPVGSIPP